MWNINGLSTDKLIEQIDHFKNFDIILLCETWLKPQHPYDMNIQGYKSINITRSPTNVKAKRGSGGLMCYIKKEIEEGVNNVPCEKCSEDRLWLKLDAVFFGLDKDVYLCLAYISPESSCHPASRDNLWNLLEEEIARFSTCGHIILTGDLNARTSTLPDYANHDSELHLPLPPDYPVDSAIKRTSEDKVVNNYGRELLDLCIASQLRIANGRIHPDKLKGSFTCFTPRGNSLVDYVISSANLLNKIDRLQVGEILSASDHCPLYFDLITEPGSTFRLHKLNLHSGDLLNDILDRMATTGDDVNDEYIYPASGGELPEEKIAEVYSSQEFLNKLSNISAKLASAPATECADQFSTLLRSSLKTSTKKNSKRKKSSSFPHNTWFDEECKQSKKTFKRSAKKLKEDPDNPLLRDLSGKTDVPIRI